jgi:hypothetical protein
VKCPWCREQLPALGRSAQCPHCGKAIETAGGEKVRTLDLDYDAVLADADATSLRWCGRGAVFALCAALFSLVPIVGAAAAYVVLVIGQFFWTGVFVARPYHRHFSPLRRLVTRWVRRLGLVLLVLPAHAATFVPFFGLVATPAVFYVACRLVRAYARFHLVREKERRPVTFAEKALLVGMVAVVLVGLCVAGFLVYLGVLVLDWAGK